jgi:DNA (cytosine-5)-methyltransferase 1
MTGWAYYNEIDAYAAQWLRNLMAAGLIPEGEVDERSIVDVRPDELGGFRQCHFFAGIGGWSRALALADWPEGAEVWTGSCPCQPLSGAGQRRGHADERHLWPAFFRLIAERRPAIVFGEQVASKDGREWLAGVRADLEILGYACGAADLCAAGIGAPHIRQRLWWVANASGKRRQQDAGGASGDESPHGRRAQEDHLASGDGEVPDRVGHADSYHEHWWSGPVQVGWNGVEAQLEEGGRRYRAQWRLKPGLSLLAHGVPRRVERLCAYGNAIVPQLGAEFIRAVMDQ